MTRGLDEIISGKYKVDFIKEFEKWESLLKDMEDLDIPDRLVVVKLSLCDLIGFMKESCIPVCESVLQDMKDVFLKYEEAAEKGTKNIDTAYIFLDYSKFGGIRIVKIFCEKHKE